jgi:hypothetical protein
MSEDPHLPGDPVPNRWSANQPTELRMRELGRWIDRHRSAFTRPALEASALSSGYTREELDTAWSFADRLGAAREAWTRSRHPDPERPSWALAVLLSLPVVMLLGVAGLCLPFLPA